MKKQCFNCGNFFTKEEITKEHIPAKALYAGYDNEYKLNRITVPSCYKCNQSFSESNWNNK